MRRMVCLTGKRVASLSIYLPLFPAADKKPIDFVCQSDNKSMEGVGSAFFILIMEHINDIRNYY